MNKQSPVSRAICLVPVILCAMDAHSRAQELSEQPIEDLSFDELLGVIEAPSRYEEPLSTTPVSAATITAEQIARSGAQSIPELLRYVTSVLVVRHTHDSSGISIRGVNDISENNLIALIDGHHVTSEYDGETDWTNLPVVVEDIERIEVVRGPASVIYGANAYTGVVNIVRKQPVQATNTQLAVITGAPATLGVSGRMAVMRDRAGYKLAMRYWETTARLPEDVGESTAAILDVGAQWSLSDTVRLRMNLSSSIARQTQLTSFFPDPAGQNTMAVFESAALTWDSLGLAPDDDLTFRQSVHRTRLHPERDETGAAELRQLQYQKLDAELAYRASLASRDSTTLSLGFRYISVETPAIAEQRRSVPYYSAAVHEQLSATDKLTLSGGLRVDYNAFVLPAKLSYRVGAVFAIVPSYVVRLSAGSAFRHPTFVESIGNFRDPDSGFIFLLGAGTENLMPPENLSAEVGGRGKLAPGLIFDTAIFLSRLSNLLEQEHRTIPATFVNRGARDLVGIEADVTYARGSSMTVTGGYAFVRVYDRERDTVLRQAPSHQAHLLLSNAWRGLMTYAELRYTSSHTYAALTGIPASLLNVDIGAGLVGGLRANYSLPGAGLEVSLRASNAFVLGSRRASPYQHGNEHERIVMATLSYGD